jgi:ribulose 1,5-bisphosphate synthetase/thiazole synthase
MRVVIVGGGFGGIRAALNLANQPGFRVSFGALSFGDGPFDARSGNCPDGFFRKRR